MNGQEYVGEREAQQIVGCGRTMLWKLVRNGKVSKQKNSNKNVVIDSGMFLKHLRQAAKLTSEESRSVKFSFEKDKLTLSSSNPEMGEATINMSVKYGGEAFEIRFNPAYLVDVLRALPDGEISFEFSEPTRPGVITTGKEFIYVVMPVHTN